MTDGQTDTNLVLLETPVYHLGIILFVVVRSIRYLLTATVGGERLMGSVMAMLLSWFL